MRTKQVFSMILVLVFVLMMAGCGTDTGSADTGMKSEIEPNAGDSVSESTVSDGCYIALLIGSNQGEPSGEYGTIYSIAKEEDTIVVNGSMNFNQDPELTWLADSTDLMTNGVVRFPITEDTEFVASGGEDGDEPFESSEEFIRVAQEFMDTDNGLGFIVSVKDGKAVRVAMAS